jgi:hypothetical protein
MATTPVLQNDFTTANAAYSSPNVAATVNKPAGLAVGEILIAFASLRSTSVDIAGGYTPAGWTLLESAGGFNGSPNTGAEIWSAYKIADSSDVAASNFTFTWSVGVGAAASGIVYLARITGKNPVTPVSVHTVGTNGYDSGGRGSVSYTGVTQAYADALLIMVAGNNNSSSSFSNYAIATSNPTWTEIVDAGGGSARIGIATAARPQQTATGNFSFNMGDSTNNTWSGGILIEVSAPQAATVACDPITVTTSLLPPTIKVGIRIAMAVITVTTTIVAPVIKLITAWTNGSKNTTSWTNQDKT